MKLRLGATLRRYERPSRADGFRSQRGLKGRSSPTESRFYENRPFRAG